MRIRTAPNRLDGAASGRARAVRAVLTKTPGQLTWGSDGKIPSICRRDNRATLSALLMDALREAPKVHQAYHGTENLTW